MIYKKMGFWNPKLARRVATVILSSFFLLILPKGLPSALAKSVVEALNDIKTKKSEFQGAKENLVEIQERLDYAIGQNNKNEITHLTEYKETYIAEKTISALALYQAKESLQKARQNQSDQIKKYKDEAESSLYKCEQSFIWSEAKDWNEVSSISMIKVGSIKDGASAQEKILHDKNLRIFQTNQHCMKHHKTCIEHYKKINKIKGFEKTAKTQIKDIFLENCGEFDNEKNGENSIVQRLKGTVEQSVSNAAAQVGTNKLKEIVTNDSETLKTAPLSGQGGDTSTDVSTGGGVITSEEIEKATKFYREKGFTQEQINTLSDENLVENFKLAKAEFLKGEPDISTEKKDVLDKLEDWAKLNPGKSAMSAAALAALLAGGAVATGFVLTDDDDSSDDKGNHKEASTNAENDNSNSNGTNAAGYSCKEKNKSRYDEIQGDLGFIYRDCGIVSDGNSECKTLNAKFCLDTPKSSDDACVRLITGAGKGTAYCVRYQTQVSKICEGGTSNLTTCKWLKQKMANYPTTCSSNTNGTGCSCTFLPEQSKCRYQITIANLEAECQVNPDDTICAYYKEGNKKLIEIIQVAVATNVSGNDSIASTSTHLTNTNIAADAYPETYQITGPNGRTSTLIQSACTNGLLDCSN